MYDIIIAGAGPAGLTAAVYARRAGKSVLLIEKQSLGGQIATSPLIENYPGFDSISGPEFSDKLSSSAFSLGAEIEPGNVISVEKSGDVIKVKYDGGEKECRAFIFATGATHRHTGVKGEDVFSGRGVSFCAVCDGNFFKGKEVAVIGGGNSAVQEAIYLSSVCSKVYIIHRRSEYRADAALVEKMNKIENIVQVTDSVPEEIKGDTAVRSVTVKNVKTSETRDIPVSGVFVSIGLVPENSAFSGLVKTNEDGYADVGENCETGVAGVFAAGDVRAKTVRQLTTAVGDGATAATAACRYIDSL